MQKDKRSVGHIKKLDEDKYLLPISWSLDEFGKRIQPSKVIHATSDTEAEKALMEFYSQREKLASERKAAAPQTLEQLYNEWMEYHVKRNLEEKTQYFYSDLWGCHIKAKGRVKLAAITPKSIYAIIDPIDKARTKNAVFKLLKAMFNKAIKWGYMTANPCNMLDTPKYKAAEKKALSDDGIAVVIQHIGDEPTKYQAIFYFAALCGLRRQEILGLTWNDIDFKHDKFKIQRAATDGSGGGTRTKNTKTERSERTLFLPSQLKNVLRRLQNEQEQQKQALGDKWAGGGWVFTQLNGKLMSIQTPTHWWNDFCDKIDVHEVTLHGLRHTFATKLINGTKCSDGSVKSLNIKAVADILGHTTTEITERYYVMSTE